MRKKTQVQHRIIDQVSRVETRLRSKSCLLFLTFWLDMVGQHSTMNAIAQHSHTDINGHWYFFFRDNAHSTTNVSPRIFILNLKIYALG